MCRRRTVVIEVAGMMSEWESGGHKGADGAGRPAGQ